MRAHQDYYAVVGHQVVTLDVDGDQGHERMTIQGDPACPQCGQDAELTVIAKYEGQTANFVLCEGCDAEWRVHYAVPPVIEAADWGDVGPCSHCKREIAAKDWPQVAGGGHSEPAWWEAADWCADCLKKAADRAENDTDYSDERV